MEEDHHDESLDLNMEGGDCEDVRGKANGTLMVEQSASLRIEKMITDSTPLPKAVVVKHPFLEHIAFQVCFGSLVFFNTLVMGFEAEVGPGTEFAPMLANFELFFTTVFFIEMVVKLTCLCKAYFDDAWNILDGFVTIMGVLDVFVFSVFLKSGKFDLRSLSILRILRLVRLVRVLKLMKQFKKIVIIINGVTDAIKTTMWVGLVLFGAIYVCAIFCVDVIGRGESAQVYPGYSDDESTFDDLEVFSEFNPHLSFGSMGRAMLTLFNIAILAEWTEVVRPVSIKQPFLLIFFVLFGLFITFGVMNVIIGLIVDNVMANARAMSTEEEEKLNKSRLSALHRIQELFRALDKDGSNLVTIEELKVCADDVESPLGEFLRDHNLRLDLETDEFFAVLDEDGDGQVDEDEFVRSMYKLLGFETDRHHAVLMMAIKQLKFQVSQIHVDCASRIGDMEQTMGQLKATKKDDGVLRTAAAQPVPMEAETPPLATGDVSLEPIPERRSPEQEEKQTKRVSNASSFQEQFHPIVPNASTELERLGRALEGMRRLEGFADSGTNVRSMDEVARILESARREAEDAIQCKLRETVAGCLKVVQHTLEASGIELPDPDMLRLNQLAQVREGVATTTGGNSSGGGDGRGSGGCTGLPIDAPKSSRRGHSGKNCPTVGSRSSTGITL